MKLFKQAEKTQKWIAVLALIIPIIANIIGLKITDITIKELPLGYLIGIHTLILATPFIFLLSARSAQRTVKDDSLQKQRKGLFNNFGVLAVFMLTIFIIIYYTRPQSFWSILLPQIPILLAICFITFRPFFPKAKELTEDDEK